MNEIHRCGKCTLNSVDANSIKNGAIDVWVVVKNPNINAGDLISRQLAIKDICNLPNCENGYSDTYDKACLIGVLEEQPAIESVPVVRCKDCKHNYSKKHNKCYNHEDIVCDYFETDGLNDDDFCSYGERS